jgi:acyl carrier protein
LNLMTDERELRILIARTTGKDVALGGDDDIVRELGLDSLGVLALLAAVERRFDTCFPDDQLGEIRTLNQILRQIRSRERSEAS